jgi:hypothetical protein
VVLSDISHLTRTGYDATSLLECQYNTPPVDFQAQRPPFRDRRQLIGYENNAWAAQAASSGPM